MDSYKFKARRRSGDIVLGTINAADASAVSSYVRNQGLIVTQISKVEDKQYFWSRWIKQKVTLYDLSVFCRQFTTLIAAGVSLITALDVLQEQTVNKELKKYIGNIAQDVHTGSSLSEAMARYPRIFPPLMINMIAAGETGGILETVLTRLATQYEKDYRLNQKIKNAFVYPAVVLTVAAIAVAVILTFVMVSIGEESGSLDFMLDKVADFYGSEVEDMSGRLQTLLEPLLILILGVIIGFIGVALLMPMFDMVTKVGNL